ncbi:MAG: glycoside hydrolase family 43 protein [Hyphomonadaceae bacterium]|nr:glycoside hydrolase family 43 protein [Hyphomonadaceae bacterium]
MAVSACASAPTQAPSEEAWLFSSFRGDGETGLHLAWSTDGLTWTALREDASFMKPEIGGELMRDPCIILGPDGRYHMVWTTGWWENNIGLAHSDDLITWSEQTLLPVMAHEPEVMNSWAPEIFWDEEAGEYVIFWSSAIPDRFPETADRGDIRSTTGKSINHRIYAVTTSDFETYSDTHLFYDGGFVSIDASLLKHGEQYLLFLKDETKRPTPEKNVRLARGASAQGPWGAVSEPFSPEGVWVEGPTAAWIDGAVHVYFDAYMEHRMRGMRSTDLETWEDISDQLSFPDGIRHGTVLPITRERLEALLAAQ